MVKFNLLELKRTKDQKRGDREQHGSNICVIQQSTTGCGFFFFFYCCHWLGHGGERGTAVHKEREREVERECINFFGFRKKYGMY